MSGFEIRFNVYANSQAEADATSAMFRQFVDDMAAKGIAVTAEKLSKAVAKWKGNYFVTSYFK